MLFMLHDSTLKVAITTDAVLSEYIKIKPNRKRRNAQKIEPMFCTIIKMK